MQKSKGSLSKRNCFKIHPIMSRFLGVLTLLLAFPVASHAQTLSSAQQALISRLMGEWKTSFRSIRSLDVRWQMSGTFADQPGVRETFKYHFTSEPARHRLDTTFYKSKPTPFDTRNSSVMVEGGYKKELRLNRNGFSLLTARPATPKDRHSDGAVNPLVSVFGWARDDQSQLSLEDFGGDALWQRFARRVQNIAPGTWQGRKGWWIDVNGTGSAAIPVRVFVDGTHFFPYFATRRERFETKEGARHWASEMQVTQTQKWTAAGKTRLMPLRLVARIWRHDLHTGKRTVDTHTEQVTAPIQINGPVASQRWPLQIPAKTLVYLALSAAMKMEDERPFYFDPKAGSLWTQDSASRQRRAAKLRQLAARRIYDEKADGETQIAEALRLAQNQNKNVLLQFGAWWCPPCHVLHDLLKNDATLAPLVRDNFIAVSIDVNEGHNEAVVKRLSAGGQGGIPFMVILAADGRRLAAPPTEDFASKKSEDAFDAEKLAAFLKRWKPQS